MKISNKQPKTRILATKKVATTPKKGSTLNFVAFSDAELAAARNPAYKYLVK